MSIPPQAADPNLGQRWVAFLLIAVAGLVLIFGGIADHQFLRTWDDVSGIKDNARIHALSWESLHWMFSTMQGGNWKPLTWFSLSLDATIWGVHPLPFKVHNILLHLGSSTLVVFLLRDLMKLGALRTGIDRDAWSLQRNWWAFAGGLLFLFHPQHVESVVWISERKDVLFAFFYLAAVVFYLRWVFTQRSLWRNLSLLAGVLSMLSKPMAMSLPIALVLIDIYRSGATGFSSLSRVVLESIHRHLTLILFAALVGVIIIGANWGNQSGVAQDLVFRTQNAGFAILWYLYGFFLPFDLSTYYPFPPWIRDRAWYAWAPLLSVGAMLGVCIYLWNKGRRAFPLLAAYSLLAIFPVLGIVKVPLLTYADRFVYIPFVTLYLLIPVFVQLLHRHLGGDKGRFAFLVLSGVVGIVFVFESRSHVDWWASDRSLWERVAERNPGDSVLAHSHLAVFEMGAGRTEQAKAQFQTALKADPESLGALFLYSVLLIDEGELDRARMLVGRMLEYGADDSEGMYLAARLLLRLGDVEHAFAVVERALESRPTHSNLLSLRMRLGGYRPGDKKDVNSG